MKALKAITIGTSALALIPLVSAADGGLISQGAEVLFGATTGGGIFTKLGLFIILFAFLMLGSKKVFPEEQSKVAMLVAALLALMGMKFMPEVWIAGLGTLIWIAALALLPYAIVTIFLKEDTKKKWIFVAIAYAVLLFVVFQMKGFPSFARSLGLRGEFWEDMSYKFGAIGRYWYVWIIAAALVALFVWLFTRKGKGGDSGSKTLKPEDRVSNMGGGGPGMWEPKEKKPENPEDRVSNRGKGPGMLEPKEKKPENPEDRVRSGPEGPGEIPEKIKKPKKPEKPEEGPEEKPGEKKPGRVKRGIDWINNLRARREGKKRGEEFRKRELEYDAEQKRIIEEREANKKAMEEGRLKGEEFKKLEKEYDERQKKLIEERKAAEEGKLRGEEFKAREKAEEEGRLRGEEFKAREKAQEEGKLRGEEFKAREKSYEEGRLRGEEFKQKERLAEEEQRRLQEAREIAGLSREDLIKKYNEINEKPIDPYDIDKLNLREKLWREIQNKERILAEQRRAEEQRSLADKVKESGRNLLEKAHLLPAHAGPSGEVVTEIDRRREAERIRLEELRMRERGVSEAEIEKFKRLAMEKQEREIMRMEIAQKAAEHTEQMAREAKIKNEEKAALRKHEEEYSHEEREREISELKAREEELGWLERRRLRKLEEETLALKRREEERLREEEAIANKRKQEEEMWREREAQQKAEQKELLFMEEQERKAALKAEKLAQEERILRERRAAEKAEQREQAARLKEEERKRLVEKESRVKRIKAEERAVLERERRESKQQREESARLNKINKEKAAMAKRGRKK